MGVSLIVYACEFMHIHAEICSVNLDMQRGILIYEYINTQRHDLPIYCVIVYNLYSIYRDTDVCIYIYIVCNHNTCVYASIVYVCKAHMYALEYLTPTLEFERANVFENNFPENENFRT